MPTVDEIREKIRKNFPSDGVAKRNTPLEWTRLGKDELVSVCGRYTIVRRNHIALEGGRPFQRFEAMRGTATYGIVLGLDFPTPEAAKAAAQADALR